MLRSKKIPSSIKTSNNNLMQEQLHAWGLSNENDASSFFKSEKFRDALEEMKTGGRSLKEQFSIAETGIDALYKKAVNFYRMGFFEKSAYYFRILSLIDYKENKYLLALNACNRKLDKKIEALTGYFLIVCRDPKNAVALINLAEIGYELECDEDVKNTLDVLETLNLKEDIIERVQKLRLIMS